MNEMINGRNIEVIDNVPVDWNKFKSKARGKLLEKAKVGYMELCKIIYKNGHVLESEYINNTTKVLVNYNCNHASHKITPKDYKKGVKCPKCAGTCPEQAKEDFFNMLEDNGHTLESEYVNNTTKVLINYGCGHSSHWLIPSDYKNGVGCPKCAGKCPEQAKEEFMMMLKDNGHTLESEYIDTRAKVLINFNCNHPPNWLTVNNYKNGQGCPKCAGKCPEQAKEDFFNMLKDNGHTLESEYINTETKVLINYNCNHVPNWVSPEHYKRGQGCPKCAGTCPEQAKEEFMMMLKDNGHTLESEYVNARSKVLINFGCGHSSHWIGVNNYKSGQGCPMCKNKGEKALYSLLNNMFDDVEIQKEYEDLKLHKSLPYDFFLPKYNLLIELDGDHHRTQIVYYSKDMTDEEMEVARENADVRLQDRMYKDKLKDDYAKNNNIPLLRIPYYNANIELDKWKELILNKINEIEGH